MFDLSFQSVADLCFYWYVIERQYPQLLINLKKEIENGEGVVSIRF